MNAKNRCLKLGSPEYMRVFDGVVLAILNCRVMSVTEVTEVVAEVRGKLNCGGGDPTLEMVSASVRRLLREGHVVEHAEDSGFRMYGPPPDEVDYQAPADGPIGPMIPKVGDVFEDGRGGGVVEDVGPGGHPADGVAKIVSGLEQCRRAVRGAAAEFANRANHLPFGEEWLVWARAAVGLGAEVIVRLPENEEIVRPPENEE